MLTDIIKRITIADWVDIFLVASVIYAFLLLFKRTKVSLIVRGIAISALVLVAARFLRLQLFTSMLQAFFAVFLIAMVVIFQDEIRRTFEQIAIWSSKPWAKKMKVSPADWHVNDMLLDAVFKLSTSQAGSDHRAQGPGFAYQVY